MNSSLRFKFLIAFSILAISGLMAAQDDPPSRVMRLQFVEGQVSLQPGGVDDWVAANLNRPLTTADRIWTDQDSRAELTMASAALRMGSETSVTLTNLDDSTAQIELDQGTLNLSVRYLNSGEIVEVDTPNYAYTVTRPGEYRFDVFPNDDQSWITVSHGDGEATGQGNGVRVRSGQSFRFSSGQSLSYTDSGSPQRDGFDDWCAVRERREASSRSAGYVAAGTVGYEDLDDNGSWQPSPTYGNVWYPRVHAGWAPYREGHWAWVEPWGWTWVDDAPWGFAPFHYGRWVNAGDRWGWVPGPVGVRPVYAPALVAFVGGSSWGVSIGIGGGGGGVGWFPLGWRDPYLPSYRVSPQYARNVNISNSRVVNVTTVNNYYTTTNVNVRNTTVNNIRYENATVNGAVTGVSSSTFASGKPVGRNSVVVPANAVGRTNMMAAPTVVPTKAAVLGGRAPAAVPQHIVAPRQVVSKAAPPPRPVSFEQQRPLLEKSNGIPLSAQTRSDLRKSSPPPAPRGGQPVGQPAGNQQGGRQPGANQPRGNQQGGRPPVANVPDTPKQGVSPAAGTVHGQPSNPGQPNNQNPGRPATQQTPPANVNQNGTHNVPHPPQAGSNPNVQQPAARPGDNRGNNSRAPVTETPRTNQGNQSPQNQGPQNQHGDRTVNPGRPANPPTLVAPPQPPRNQAPVREAAPPQPPKNQAPTREGAPTQSPKNQAPARQVAPPPPRNQPPARDATPPPPRNPPPARKVEPPPQHRNPPPPKENKEQEKEKEPKGH